MYGSLLASTGYWFTFAAFSLFLANLLRLRITDNDLNSIKSMNWGLAFCCLAIAALMFLREGPSFKITMDEPVLANVAISMHEHRDTSVREYSLSTELGSQTVVDKRPFLFPFLVSLVHDIFGVQPLAPFFLNLALTCTLLILTFIAIQRTSGRISGAIIAIAAIATHPLFIQNSSGGGFDILNCVLIITVGLLAANFYKIPSERSLNILVFSAVLLAYTRYESALFVPAVGLLILIQFIQSKKVIIPKLTILAPILMLPTAWQNRYISSMPEFWQLSDPSHKPFGFNYLENNLASAYKFFFTPGPDLASSPIFSIAALLAAIYLVTAVLPLNRLRKVSQNTAFWPALIISIFVAINFALLMLYWWGTLSDVAASRLALPVLSLGTIAIGIAHNHLAKKRPYLRWIAPAIIALSAIYSFPVSSRAEYSKLSLQSRQFEWLLKDSGIKIDQNDLVIGGLARIWSTYQIPAIAIKRAIYNWESLKLHHELKTYDNIFVVQQLHSTLADGHITEQLNSGNDLGPAFELETLAETSIYQYNLTRISRLTKVKPDAIEEVGGSKTYHNLYANVPYQAHLEVSLDDRITWQKSLP